MIGRKMYGGTSTYLPLKVNQAGVIPVIFATSLLYLPLLLVQLVGADARSNADGTGEVVSGWWRSSCSSTWSTRAAGCTSCCTSR